MPIKRREPGVGDQPDYSRVIYADPPSHDFCVFLIIAELMRCHYGAGAPLQVKFGLINGQLGICDFGPYSLSTGKHYPCNLIRAYSDQMMVHVLRPAIAMIGAVEEPAAHAPFDAREIMNWVEYDYHIGHLVDAGRQGYDIPKWKPPQWAFDEVDRYLAATDYGFSKESPVVITLREVDHQPERNSQLAEWQAFAASIDTFGCDHPVIFIRDTAKASEPIGRFTTWPRASQNAYVRVALYQRAFCNLMVCNGPNTWVIFSDAPYLIFKELVPALPDWDHGQPKGWKEQDHMNVGDQYPWASPLQRLTWTDDTFDNIRAAFDDFLAAAKIITNTPLTTTPGQ